MTMNTHIDAKAQSEMAAYRETTTADQVRLAGCGFTSEEIVALLWLQQWYQAGGSDRVEVLRHWEFLKFLVLTGKVAIDVATSKRIWPRLRFHAKDQPRCAFCGLLCSGDSSFPVSGTHIL